MSDQPTASGTTDEQETPDHIKVIWDQIDTLTEDQQLEQLELLVTALVHHIGPAKILTSVGDVINAWFGAIREENQNNLREPLVVLRNSVYHGKKKLSSDKGQAALLLQIDKIAETFDMKWNVKNRMPTGEGLAFYNELAKDEGGSDRGPATDGGVR